MLQLSDIMRVSVNATIYGSRKNCNTGPWSVSCDLEGVVSGCGRKKKLLKNISHWSVQDNRIEVRFEIRVLVCPNKINILYFFSFCVKIVLQDSGTLSISYSQHSVANKYTSNFILVLIYWKKMAWNFHWKFAQKGNHVLSSVGDSFSLIPNFFSPKWVINVHSTFSLILCTTWQLSMLTTSWTKCIKIVYRSTKNPHYLRQTVKIKNRRDLVLKSI